MFEPVEKFRVLESTPSANLLNLFGMEGYEDHEGEETYNGVLQQVQSNQSTPFVPDTLELEELVDGENAKKDGLQSMVDMGDGKRIHKAKVLHEFTRFTRTS